MKRFGTVLTLTVVAATLVTQALVPMNSANAISLYQSCKQMKPFAHRALLGGKAENIDRGYED
ncbi:hypothetical protein KDA14_00840, partial [Candidatus Saccharibacteria bacterium]|nr:hypothetical protein [Candidatus Saccharibacteria bacterium]